METYKIVAFKENGALKSYDATFDIKELNINPDSLQDELNEIVFSYSINWFNGKWYGFKIISINGSIWNAEKCEDCHWSKGQSCLRKDECLLCVECGEPAKTRDYECQECCEVYCKDCYESSMGECDECEELFCEDHVGTCANCGNSLCYSCGCECEGEGCDNILCDGCQGDHEGYCDTCVALDNDEMEDDNDV